MFGYVGESFEEVSRLYAALKLACAEDPYVKAAFKYSCHGDGWGYAIHASNGLFHYRTSRAIFSDDILLPRMEGTIHAIFHGRLATNKKLLGHIFSHPFVVGTNTQLMFLAHNGALDEEKISLRDGQVDSEWALEQIARVGSLPAALPELREQTKSALNLLLMTNSRNQTVPPKLEYTNFYKPPEKEKIAYYKMFLGKLAKGRAVFSSTLTLHKFAGLEVTGEAPFDKPSFL